MDIVTNVQPKAQERCSHCGGEFKSNYDFTPGYAWHDGKKVCYDCCALFDRAYMTRKGKITLYLADEGVDLNSNRSQRGTFSVQNWPGTLRLPVMSYKKGNHNMASGRIDVWFAFEGYVWHGVQYGKWTQVLHCKRTKKKHLPRPFLRDETLLAS